MEILESVIEFNESHLLCEELVQISMADTKGTLEGSKPIFWLFYTAEGKEPSQRHSTM